MSIALPCRVGELADCAVGELVGVFTDQIDIGLVLAHMEDRTAIGILAGSAAESGAYIERQHSKNDCLIFKSGWELEFLPPTSTLIGYDCSTVGGSVSIDREGAHMRFSRAPGDSGGRPLFFNLNTGQASNGPSGSYVILPGWRLWLDASAKSLPHRTPFIEMGIPVVRGR